MTLRVRRPGSAISTAVEIKPPPFDSRTQAKQLACSSPHKKKGRLVTDSFFNVWRWRESNPRAEGTLI
jgi:hypothetical protein